MAWKILLLSIVSISLMGCRNVPREIGNHKDWREDFSGGRLVDERGLARRMGAMEIQFEASYERDGARVAVKGRL